MKNILVTGGRGFIGFNFLEYVHTNYPQYQLVNVDKQTYASKIFVKEKDEFFEKTHIFDYLCDITNIKEIEDIVIYHDIDTIVNFAAESHVDNSISNPGIFVEANVVGTANLLEISRKHNLRFHQISTDEVYGSVDPAIDVVDENFHLSPSSPYSSSKTAADLITISYFKTFGLNATVSRCSNNFGPYQHVEKLLPKTICNALSNKKIPIYSNGLQKRFWIHVNDHNEAVMRILENGKAGEIYNIAPTPANLKTNIEVVQHILSYLGKDQELIEHVADRPGHDLCYYLIGKKLVEECNFSLSEKTFENQLDSTIDWYSSMKRLV